VETSDGWNGLLASSVTEGKVKRKEKRKWNISSSLKQSGKLRVKETKNRPPPPEKRCSTVQYITRLVWRNTTIDHFPNLPPPSNPSMFPCFLASTCCCVITVRHFFWCWCVIGAASLPPQDVAVRLFFHGRNKVPFKSPFIPAHPHKTTLFSDDNHSKENKNEERERERETIQVLFLIISKRTRKEQY